MKLGFCTSALLLLLVACGSGEGNSGKLGSDYKQSGENDGTCSSDSDCIETQECALATCLEAPCPPGNCVNRDESCQSNADCGANEQCQKPVCSAGQPCQGICVLREDAGGSSCPTDTECPGGQQCVELSCDDAAQCRARLIRPPATG